MIQLIYKGKIVDQKASPRELHVVHAEANKPHLMLGPDNLPWDGIDGDGLIPNDGGGDQLFNQGAIELPQR